MIFKFNAHTEVVVCDELNSAVLDILDLENARRVLMIADENVLSNSRAKELVGFLGNKYDLDLQAMESREPTTELVNEVSGKFKEKEYPDVEIVSVNPLYLKGLYDKDIVQEKWNEKQNKDSGNLESGDIIGDEGEVKTYL